MVQGSVATQPDRTFIDHQHLQLGHKRSVDFNLLKYAAGRGTVFQKSYGRILREGAY